MFEYLTNPMFTNDMSNMSCTLQFKIVQHFFIIDRNNSVNNMQIKILTIRKIII